MQLKDCTVNKKGGDSMNNYERSRVVELGRASDVIRSAKIWALLWIDSEAIINRLDLWVEDIDESDD
jgi:hypothetical protein